MAANITSLILTLLKKGRVGKGRTWGWKQNKHPGLDVTFEVPVRHGNADSWNHASRCRKREEPGDWVRVHHPESENRCWSKDQQTELQVWTLRTGGGNSEAGTHHRESWETVPSTWGGGDHHLRHHDGWVRWWFTRHPGYGNVEMVGKPQLPRF